MGKSVERLNKTKTVVQRELIAPCGIIADYAFLMSMIDNLKFIQGNGIEKFLRRQEKNIGARNVDS